MRPTSIRIAPLGRPLATSLRAAQALLDPAAIVKELLENSLDAQATRIDLRLRGAGCLSSIVVSDNGKGIKETDLERVCLPSTTSKMSELVDIERIASFGFRGEALSAICGIARCVSIASRTAGQDVAKCAQYGPGGHLIRISPAARGVGTTVNVEDVFHRLPVRKKEALAHPARQLTRCIAVVQAAALISVSVRVELRVGNDLKVANAPLLHQPKEQNAQSSENFQTALRKNAIAVLGRSANALHEVSGCIAQVIRSAAEPGEKTQYKCSGLVSSASLNAKGGGRARSSHQFFFINCRPVNLPRLQRSASELYRRATGLNGASPAIIINLDLPLWAVDVNLSPDKSSVAIFEEEKLAEGLMRLLEEFWIPTDKTQIPINRVGDVGILLNAKHPSQMPKPSQERLERPERILEESESKHSSILSSVPSADHEKETCLKNADHQTVVEDIPELPCLSSDEEPNGCLRNEDVQADMAANESQSTEKDTIEVSERENAETITKAGHSKPISPEAPRINSQDLKSLKMSLLTGKRPSDLSSYIARRSQSSRGMPKRLRLSPPRPPRAKVIKNLNDENEKGRQRETNERTQEVPTPVLFDAPRSAAVPQTTSPKISTIPANWDVICNDYTRLAEERKKNSDESVNNRKRPSVFEKSSMQKCEDEAVSVYHQGIADNEMSRLFRQAWFKELKVVGQFNRGFIIARFGSDMFIVDQHASDEKYNFEELERTTVISTQKLVRPMPLEFSAEDELIVLQYLDAFRAGGFDIEHNGNKPPTQRLLLRSQPTSKHTIFVREDLQDMINLLKNSVLHSPANKLTLLRPPRVRAMLASRACRKSIMVGRALSISEMNTVLRHLAELQRPWTCPHGRPTMRHLFELPKS
ncbi:unnamed protein product [Agarophyton chilense]